MISAIYAIGRVQGAELFLLGCVLCILLCIGVGLLFHGNRNPQGRKRFLLSVGAAAAISDAVLFLVLFPQGEYHNYGIGSMYGALLYPATLCVTAVVTTALNLDEE